MYFMIFILLFSLSTCFWMIHFFSKGTFSIDTVEDKNVLAKTVEENRFSTREVDKEKEEKQKTADEAEEIEKVEEGEGNQSKYTKKVYLTFDDGPSKWTGDILDVLKEHGIQATFFMQGDHLQKSFLQPDVKRAVEEGHYVGAHSMTHDYNELYKKRKFVSEMEEALNLIHSITGTYSQLVRPPYGSIPGLKDKEIRNQVIEAGLKVWDWTVDSQDWKYQNDPEKILNIIESETTKDVEVILMHEKEQTLKLLPNIIAYLKEQGYGFEVYRDQNHFPNNFLSDNRF